MKIKIATYATEPRNSKVLFVYDGAYPPGGDDVIVLHERVYEVKMRALYLEGNEPEWQVFVS